MAEPQRTAMPAPGQLCSLRAPPPLAHRHSYLCGGPEGRDNRPITAQHVCAAAQLIPVHLSTQLPPRHFCVLPQVTPAHGSTQLPATQVWPAGHTAPEHLLTQLPLLQ